MSSSHTSACGRIRNIKEQLDLSDALVGRLLGVGRMSVYFWRSDKKEPGTATMRLVELVEGAISRGRHAETQWRETLRCTRDCERSRCTKHGDGLRALKLLIGDAGIGDAAV